MDRQRRKEDLDAAKSRLTSAAEKSRVNEGLKRILPGRAFGSRLGKRLPFKQRPKQQLNAHVLPEGAGTPQADAAGSQPNTAADGAVQERSADGAAATASAVAPKAAPSKLTLGSDELLFVLKRDPVYARSAAHYRIRSEHAASAAAAAAAAE